MSFEKESLVTSAIQRYEGTPNKRGRRGEGKRWARFRNWFIGWFKQGDELGANYVEAKVSEAQAEADMKRERVAEIAARTDVLKNKGVKAFCDLIDDQFAKDDPELARALKLAKLLEANPAIAEQVSKVNALREKLARERGVRVEPHEDRPQKRLPDKREQP